MAAGIETLNYTNPSSGTAVVFYNDGSDRRTQAAYLCDPASPGTPLGTPSAPLPVTAADVLAAVKEGNELLLLILNQLEKA